MAEPGKRPRKTDSERGGSYWVKSKNMVQVTGYLEPQLHNDLIAISEQTGVPITKMIIQSLSQYRDHHMKKKAKGVDG